LANRYVTVAISRETQAIAQAGFGVPFILATEKDAAYKEFDNLVDVAADFGSNSNTYKLASALFGQSPTVEKIAIVGVSFTEGTTLVSVLTDKLNATRLVNDNWYYLLCPAHADATIVALASWANANDNKLYFATTSNKTLAATLNADRAVVLVHPTPAQYPEAAWVGVCAPKAVGSYTWTFKTLVGIDPSGYVATDINTIESNNASTYIKEGGINITSKGVTTSGEYIDIIQGQDFITSSMTTGVYNLLANSDKVPYSSQGIAMVIAEIEKTFKDAHDAGIIAEDEDGKPLFKVEAPKFGTISGNDKANRVLPNVKWSATIAGAIENVDINGVLTL
jgi:PKD repeat protein